VKHHLAGLLLLALAAIVSVAAIAPPSPRGLDAPAPEFSAARARAHLDHIARAPHPTGSAEIRDVRAYLTGALAAMGLDVSVQERSAAARVTGTVWSARAANVVARLPGTRGAGPALMLAAHYDSVAAGPGAADDGSGVAILLETARALAAGRRPASDVLFVFTDGEEMALRGAQAAVEEEGLLAGVKLVLNFEARGTRGAVALFETSESAGRLVDGFASAAPHPIASSFITTLAGALPNGTDSLVWKGAGFDVLGFAFAEGLEDYHGPTDTPGRVDLGSLQHGGATALALARRFGDGDLLALRAPDVVYFDLLGRVVVHYSTAFARAAGGATLAFLAAIVLRGVRARRVRAGSVGKGAAMALGAIVLAAAAVTGTNLLLGRFLDFTARAAHGGTFAWHGLLLASAVCVASFSWLLPRHAPRDLALGAMVPWAALLAMAIVAAPALSAIFEWPLLFALAGLLACDRVRSPLPSYVGAAPGVILFANVVYAVFVATGASMPFAPIVFFGLLAVLLGPLLAHLPARARGSAAIGLLVASVGFAVFGWVTARGDTREPHAESFTYALDADRPGDARWVGFEPGSPGATPTPAVSAPLPGFTRSDTPETSAPAPVRPLAPADVVIRSDTAAGGARTLALRIVSARRARCLKVWDAGGARIAGSPEIGGVAVRDFYRISPEADEEAFRAMTGDRTYRVWHMEHCGLAPDGALDITVVAARDGKVRLRVVEESEGLPGTTEDGSSPSLPRPDGLSAGAGDVTLVGRTFEL
jgi:hypothetical protein